MIGLLIELVILSRPVYLTYNELCAPNPSPPTRDYLLKYWVGMCLIQLIMKGAPLDLVTLVGLLSLAVLQHPLAIA